MKHLILSLMLTGCASLKTPPDLYSQRTVFRGAPQASPVNDCQSLVKQAQEAGVDLSEDAAKRCAR